MKVFTQAEYDDFPLNEKGMKICPTGDYSEIKIFYKNCEFGNNCKFNNNCQFDKYSIFGIECEFGSECYFDDFTTFEIGNSFASNCKFGKNCHFCSYCKFGNNCIFGRACSFDGKCCFHTGCSFAQGCTFDTAQDFFYEQYHYCTFGKFVGLLTCSGYGSERRHTYFWIMANHEIMVECGCFYGNLNAWEEEVKRVYPNDPRGDAYLAQAAAVRAQAAYIWKMEEEN